MSVASSLGAVDLAEVVVRFGQALQHAGLRVPAERRGRFATALTLTEPATRNELYWTARVTLVADHTQLPVFDRVFAHVFGGLADVAEVRGQHPPPAHVRPRRGAAPPPRATGEIPGARPAPSPVPTDAPGSGDDGDGRDTVLAAASREERLRTTDFAALTPEELAVVRQLLRRVELAPPPRRARRRVRDRRGRRVDLRASLGRARRTGGDPAGPVRTRPRTRPRRLVLLCDISGSMEPYARAYLQLLHAAVTGGARAEAFVFATRLTRLTRQLRTRRPDLALAAAGARAPDWSGGTRIGEALRRFVDDHGRRGVAGGAVVVIVSDGWERDDPDLVGEQMARLARLAHRVVWVNPRRADPRYAPLAGGMAAALPHVDAFVSGHSVAALDEVVAAIGGHRTRPA